MLSNDQINELLTLNDDALVNVVEAAAIVGLAPASLDWYRCNRPERGPRFRRVGSRTIRYRMGDLREYIAAHSGG